jgi:hypothetical protein
MPCWGMVFLVGCARSRPDAEAPLFPALAPVVTALPTSPKCSASPAGDTSLPVKKPEETSVALLSPRSRRALSSSNSGGQDIHCAGEADGATLHG